MREVFGDSDDDSDDARRKREVRAWPEPREGRE